MLPRPRRPPDSLPMNDNAFVRTAVSDSVATVTIDRQNRLNALNPEVIAQLDAAFAALRDDAGVRAVILTGAGDKAFVAGADIGVLATMGPRTGVAVSREGQDVLRRIERFPRPVIAAVGGYALGGGCELAIACHLRVASEQARFGLPEVGLGIIPGYGGTVRLARLVGLGRAVEMVLTGEMVTAERAFDIGLANAVVPHGQLMERAGKLAARIVRNAPVALEMALKSMYEGVESTMDHAQEMESARFGLLASTDDMREGMAAFLEKRRADFKGE